MEKDGPYKRLLMQPWMIREFAAGFLPDEVAARIKLDSFRRYPTETVRRDPKKRKKYQHLLSDVMWQFEFDDNACGYVLLMIEAQSRVDRLMPVRMCRYVLGWHELLMEAEGLRTLPPIIAAVVYNGEQPWDVQTQLSEMIEVPAALRGSGFAFDRYVLVDEKDLYERGALPAGNVFGPLIAALQTGDAGEFARSFGLALERAGALAAGPEALELVREFILDLKGQGRRSELAEVVRQQEGDTMVRATLADFEQQMRQRGLDEGRKIGLEQGMQQGMEQGMERGMQDSKLEFARLLVGDGKSEQEVQRYTGLSIREIRQIRRGLARAGS